MRKLVNIGISVLLLVFLNSVFSPVFQDVASAQTDSVPGLAVSDEEIFVEESGGKLTLFWGGLISFVKPSTEPVSVVIESSLSPLGQWQPVAISRFRIRSDKKIRVNSVYQKSPVAYMALPTESGLPSAFANFFEKDQVINVKIAIKGAGQTTGGKSISEIDYRLKPLGYALLKAVQAGDFAGVNALLDKGADPDATDLKGWSALMAAASAGRGQIVRLLLDKGAKINARTKAFPIILSANGSAIPGGSNALIAAAYSGRPDIVSLLLEKHAQVNTRTDDKWTPLMAACFSGSGETVRMLLDAGADQDVVNESGYSPLAMAIINRNRGAVHILKARGAVLTVPW